MVIGFLGVVMVRLASFLAEGERVGVFNSVLSDMNCQSQLGFFAMKGLLTGKRSVFLRNSLCLPLGEGDWVLVFRKRWFGGLQIQKIPSYLRYIVSSRFLNPYTTNTTYYHYNNHNDKIQS